MVGESAKLSGKHLARQYIFGLHQNRWASSDRLIYLRESFFKLRRNPADPDGSVATSSVSISTMKGGGMCLGALRFG